MDAAQRREGGLDELEPAIGVKAGKRMHVERKTRRRRAEGAGEAHLPEAPEEGYPVCPGFTRRQGATLGGRQVWSHLRIPTGAVAPGSNSARVNDVRVRRLRAALSFMTDEPLE